MRPNQNPSTGYRKIYPLRKKCPTIKHALMRVAVKSETFPYTFSQSQLMFRDNFLFRITIGGITVKIR